MKNIKFEYVLTVILVGIIAAVIFVNPDLTESAKQGYTALIGILGGVTGFMWGIRMPPNNNNVPQAPQEIKPTNITNDMK